MCLMCLITSLITVLCSVQPDTPGRKAFCMLGSINVFVVGNVVVLLERMGWNVFPIVFESAIGRKLVGSVVDEFNNAFCPCGGRSAMLQHFGEECG